MASLAFDTLKAARRLGDAGFSESQAEAIVGTLSEGMTENLTTKDDLEALEDRLDTKIDTSIETLRRDMTIRLGTIMVGGLVLITLLDRVFAT